MATLNFENCGGAFDPMFGDAVVIKGPARENAPAVSTTVSACVLDDADDLPVSEEVMDAARRAITITVDVADFHYFTAMRRGDFIFYRGDKYELVSSRYDAVLGYTIKARSVQRGTR